MILGGTIYLLQFSSLYNPVNGRVREHVQKMLLMGVTQRNKFVATIILFDLFQLNSTFFSNVAIK